MKRSHRWVVSHIFVLIFILGASTFFAQTPEALPSAEQIIRRAVKRARWSDEQEFEKKFSFNQHILREKLDDRGSIKEREERLYHVAPLEGEAYARLVQKNGKALTEKELKAEQERERKFRQRLAEQKTKKPKDDDDVEFNEELVSRFNFSFAELQTMNGRTAFLLTFEPKSKDLPVRRRMDRILNKLAGKLWIDQQTYEIAKAEAHLTERAKLGWGLLASVQNLNFAFEQVPVENDVWFPRQFDLAMDGRLLFSSMRQKQKIQWNDFRRAASELAQQKPAGK